LRGIAVLAVLAFHTSPSHVPGGYIGVDIFFVISGFLITSIVVDGLAGGVFSFREFYVRRIRRLVPALAIVLASVWVLGWFTMLAAELEDLGAHIAAGAGFVSNLLLWNDTGYFDRAADSKPLLHLWSLGVEEQFYLLWPALLALAWRCGIRLSGVVILVGGASLLLNIALAGSHPAAAFYLPSSRLWELLLGATLAIAAARAGSSRLARAPRWLAELLSPIGLALIVIACFTYDAETTSLVWWAILPTTGTWLILAAGEHSIVNRAVLAHPLLVFAGAISYPLYLWHWPLLTWTRVVAFDEPSAVVKAAAVAASVLLAWLTYRFLERPVRRSVADGPRLALPAALVSCLLVVMLAGLAVRTWSKELPPRFPANIQRLADYGYRYEERYRGGRCFLAPGQTSASFADDCVDASAARAPLVVLWGDSHAAQLYSGLQRLQRHKQFRIAQFTGARCPPMLGYPVPEFPACPTINEFVVQRVRTLKPTTILMAADWRLYDPRYLARTLRTLRGASAGKILVVGSVPLWTDRLPRVLFNHFRQHPLNGIPTRLSTGLGPRYPALEDTLQRAAAQNGADFVSAQKILCNDQGCLVRIGEQPDSLTAWDESHLTAEGSAVLVAGLSSHLVLAR
jgi:peptidoglycan/LPS O-acetylase OafA/YrhL